MKIHRNMTCPWLTRSTFAIVTIVASAFLGGCTTPPAVMDPFSGLREAKTRAEVERQASHDPFPSAGDVGLK